MTPKDDPDWFQKYLDERFNGVHTAINTSKEENSKNLSRVERQIGAVALDQKKMKDDIVEIKATNVEQSAKQDVIVGWAEAHEAKHQDGEYSGGLGLTTKQKAALGTIILSLAAILSWIAGILPVG